MDDSGGLRNRGSLRKQRLNLRFNSDEVYSSDEDYSKKQATMDVEWKRVIDDKTGTITLTCRESIGQRPVWEFFKHELILIEKSNTYKYTILIDGRDHEHIDVDEWFEWEKKHSQEGTWYLKKNKTNESVVLFDARPGKEEYAVAMDGKTRRALQHLEIKLSRPLKAPYKRPGESDLSLQGIVILTVLVVVVIFLTYIQYDAYVRGRPTYEFRSELEFDQASFSDVPYHETKVHEIQSREPVWK